MATMTSGGAPLPSSDYGVRLNITRPESQNRITNFPLGIGYFIRYILLIPHIIVLYFLQLVAALLYFIAQFAILFTGTYPEGMYRFVAGYLRWNTNMQTYLMSLHDKYPPFSTDHQDGYPVVMEFDYPSASSRLLNFPLFIGMLIRVIILIPHLICFAFLSLVAVIIVIVAQFAILFTGAFPEGMYRFVVGTQRWGVRIGGYVFGLTDRYPPFSMD